MKQHQDKYILTKNKQKGSKIHKTENTRNRRYAGTLEVEVKKHNVGKLENKTLPRKQEIKQKLIAVLFIYEPYVTKLIFGMILFAT
jgi:hypothetical protein